MALAAIRKINATTTDPHLPSVFGPQIRQEDFDGKVVPLTFEVWPVICK